MYWFPRTKIGKVSFWLVVSGLVTIIILNVIGQLAFCHVCPEGYMIEGAVCNPDCYRSTPACLEPSVQPTCNTGLVESTVWRVIKISLGLLAMACVLTGGVCAVLALTKYKDKAILLFIPVLIGLLGLLFVIGEFLFPH